MQERNVLSKIYIGISGVSIVSGILSALDAFSKITTIKTSNIPTLVFIIIGLFYMILDYKLGRLSQDKYHWFSDILPNCLFYNIFINNPFISKLYVLDNIVKPAFTGFLLLAILLSAHNLFRIKRKKIFKYVMIILVSVVIFFANTSGFWATVIK